MTRVASPSSYAPTIGFSAAARAGDWIHVAGTTALDAQRAMVGGEDAAEQTREILRKIAAVLDEAGASLADVVRTRIYITDADDWEAVGRAHGEAFATVRPAATMLVVGLLDPRMRVEIEALAYAAASPGTRGRAGGSVAMSAPRALDTGHPGRPD